MFEKIRLSRWLVGAVILAVAECAGLLALSAVLTAPAHAQFFSNDQEQWRRQRSQQRSSGGGFFENLFGPFNPRPSYQNGERVPPQQHYQQQQQQPADNSRAPPSRRADSKSEPPTTSIVVMGDAMADWLAYGLEDAFADSPEIGIIRKNKLHSGLLHYDAKSDLDWWHVARDVLAQEKANYVVMMLGISDRQSLRQRDVGKDDDMKVPDPADKTDADNSPLKTDQGDNPDQSIAAPEQTRGKKAGGVLEFRTDEWAQAYSRRIDETMAALKSKGVPVFWVGLPSIRGTRSTADASYLNDLYRARAERDGAIYIDVWDGFVDEGGKFTTFGPDYEGQVRRLRSADGVFFTKYGARKLAHYVERELRRYMNNRSMVSLPSGPIEPMPSDGKTARPLAGPVVPLMAMPGNSDELLGGSGGNASRADATATQVLLKGEPLAAPAGRADDFIWPRGGDARAAQPVAAASATATAAVAMPSAAPASNVAPAVMSPPVEQPAADEERAAEKKKDEPASGKTGKSGKTVQNAKPKRTDIARPKPAARNEFPRPPRPIGQQNNGGFFGFFR
jgi:hypothetical protein